MDQHIFRVSEMFESLEPFLAREQKHQQLVVPMSEQCRSLRSLSVSLRELHAFQMDFFYCSYPNLRAVEFKAAGNSARLGKEFRILGSSTPNTRANVSTTPNPSWLPDIQHPSMTLSIAEHNSVTAFGNDPDKKDYEI
ncbi:hypothetical protein BGX24_009249 [Mortierella sp. AD032]|nr:hypothetical protein BGX24_009249 [Mortierella sp. AD032]